ncbi:MAG: translation initiation factor IF-2 [Paludibacter sp.]|nr:translation initiation factor IF-2 [Paludibacter sp.]
MPIRLSKAIKELNVGMSTAVDFLAKKGYAINADPNEKISDELHLLLAKQYDKDMAAKLEAESKSRARSDKDKVEIVVLEGYITSKNELNTEHEKKSEQQKNEQKDTGQNETVIEINEPPTEQTTHIPKEQKTVNKLENESNKPRIIDLEKIRLEEQKIERAKRELKKNAEITKSQIEKDKRNEEKKLETNLGSTSLLNKQHQKKRKRERDRQRRKRKRMLQEQERIQHEGEEKTIGKSSTNDKEKLPEKTESHFIPINVKLENTPVVVGQIDLNTINQNTRPKAKSHSQKRREREERIRKEEQRKIATQKSKADNAVESTETTIKRKRERFTSKKVDIDSVAKEERQSRGKIKKTFRHEISEDTVHKQVKETLARIQNTGSKFGKGVKHRRDKRATAQGRKQEELQRAAGESKTLKLTEFVTVSELAALMDIPVNQVIGTCMNIGMFVSINQRLDEETINIVAEEFGFKTEYVNQTIVEALSNEEDTDLQLLVSRAPVVAVMGHVDHGKTSLLDYIRKTNVIAGEAGGITQHIGAYNVELENGQHITFLDTPGHEAFTAMRARGAKVTDIAIIIIAADDNVMPQTKEAINHASAAGVPIVFAINKIDKDGTNPEKIREELANMNYLVEEWGGKHQSQNISAKKGIGVSELLEKVLLEAEILELKANPNRKAIGSIIESSLDKGRGYISTVLVQNGTLHQGDIIVAGTHYGRVRAMFDERNQRQKQVLPAEPMLILGLNGAPTAGDTFNIVDTEQEAREIANRREQLQREMHLRTHKHFTLEELGRRIELGDFKELNIIVKGDVDGSVEALSDSLLKLSTEHIQVNIIHKAVGPISESDVLLAAASNAIICGFQVRPAASAHKMAEREDIEIRLYSVIYDAIEEIKLAMEGMLAPEIKEEVTAMLEVLETFKISKVGAIAGCIVRDGKIHRSDKVRVIRDGIVIMTGELESLKRLKDDVKEVGTNFECGLNIKNFNDVKIGDFIESYKETEVKPTL